MSTVKPAPRSAPHYLFLALAVALVAVVAAFGSVSFQNKLSASQPIGFDVVEHSGAWRVTAVDNEVVPALDTGDLLLFVHGQTPNSRSELRELLMGREGGELILQRADELLTVAYERPARDIAWGYIVLALIGVLYLLIGLYTALKDRQVQARLFFLWCATSAALYMLSPRLPIVDDVDRWIYMGDLLARLLLPALTLHLFLVFPSRLMERGRGRWLVPVLYLPALFLLGVHLDRAFFGGALSGRTAAIELVVIDRIELFLLVICSLLAIFSLVRRFSDQLEWEPKRQLQWLVAGLIGGYAPFVLIYVVPFAAGLQLPSWTTVMAVLPLALVPIAFAWAIFRYRLLDFDLIVRDLVSFSTAAVVGVFGFQLANLAIQSGLGQDLALARNMLTFAAGIIIAGVLVPTRNAIASGIERWQHRGHAGARGVLHSLGDQLLHERDLDRLCASLLDHIEDGLVVRANIFLSVDGGAMVPVRSAPRQPRSLPATTFGHELWQRDVRSISALSLPDVAVTAERKLFAAGFRYVFPLRVREARLGVAVVSYKFDDQPLNGEDIDLARGLLNQAALAIENATLLEEVHNQLRHVTQLEASNRGILESSPAGIAVIDAEHQIVSVNHAFAAICGAIRADLAGQNLADLLPVRPLPETDEGPIEVSYCEASGEERHLQLSMAAYLGDQHHRDRRVLVVQDVSARVTMEVQLKEKEHLASLGMLAAGVAHEVNTPLTGISSYAQFLLADTDEEDPRHEILKKMERQTFRAAQIVNNLLEFAGNRRGEMSRVQLDQVASEVLHLLEDRLATTDVELVWQPPTEPVLVTGNEGELHQVLTNLVVNATHAMLSRSGPRRLTVAIEADHTDTNSDGGAPGRASASVSDTGPGIPNERIDTVFKPFFSSKQKGNGSGLGLAISYNIVRRHGGEISVVNHDDGPGCTFTVELPRYTATPATATEAATR